MALLRNRTGLFAALVIAVAALLLSIPGFIAGDGSTPEQRATLDNIAQEEGGEPFDLLVEDEDGNPVLNDEVTCDNVVDVLDTIASAEKLDDVVLLAAYGVEDTERREVAVEKLNALSRSTPCNPAESATPTPTASPAPTPTPTVAETTSPTPADSVTEPTHFETWADVLMALPEGFVDSIQENKDSLDWDWEFLRSISGDEPKTVTITSADSCGVVAMMAGANGCADPGTTRTVLLPLGEDGTSGLVEGPEGYWSLVRDIRSG